MNLKDAFKDGLFGIVFYWRKDIITKKQNMKNINKQKITVEGEKKGKRLWN